PAPVCVVTGVDGAYALQPDAAPSVLVTAEGPGFQPAVANDGAPVSLRQGDIDGLDLTLLSKGQRVAGMVLDAFGGPVADARVALIRFVDGLQPMLEVRSDDAGNFEFWAPPGRVTL